MSITYNWDSILQGYEAMRDQTTNLESEIKKDYSSHAIGMLELIPYIREYPEFKNFDLTLSLGKLVCISKSNGARLYVAYGRDPVYHLQTYDKKSGYSDVKEYDLKQTISVLPGLLKELASN